MAKEGKKSRPDNSEDSNPTPNLSPGTQTADAGSMEKIRDILFGNQVRDFERRFTRMNEEIARAAQNLRDESHKRLDALETFFKEELAALKKRIKTDNDQRIAEEKQRDEDFKNECAALRKSITEAEEKFEQHATDLRQQILEQSKQLTEEIQSKYDQATKDLRETAAGLDETKIDRSFMAQSLIEIAMRLSDHLENGSSDPSSE